MSHMLESSLAGSDILVSHASQATIEWYYGMSVGLHADEHRTTGGSDLQLQASGCYTNRHLAVEVLIDGCRCVGAVADDGSRTVERVTDTIGWVGDDLPTVGVVPEGTGCSLGTSRHRNHRDGDRQANQETTNFA